MSIRLREKTPPEYTAVQWFKEGDHPKVKIYDPNKRSGIIHTKKGLKVVNPGEFIVRLSSGNYSVYSSVEYHRRFEEIK
jgi:precorrin-4 methylase